MNEQLRQIFNEYYMEIQIMLPKIITAIIIVLVFIVFGKLFYRIIGRQIQKRWKYSLFSNIIAESSKWSFYLLGVVIGLNIIGSGGIASSILAGAGVGAIIFGFAFKDIGENFLAGILLALNRPFDINDIIEVDGYKGTVKDLDLRITHLRNDEGKDIYLPNSSLIKNTLINYTRDGNLRSFFMVGIAPEMDINKTRMLILDYLYTNERILKDPKPTVIVDQLGEFTTDLKVLFWIDVLATKNLPESYLGHNIRSKVITDVKNLLDENAIEMPSQVIEHKMYRQNKLVLQQQMPGPEKP